MKKLLPLFIAGVVFVAALVLLRPEDTVGIVVAGRDLPAGHTLTAEDLSVRQFQKSLAPTGGYTDPALLTGQTLGMARTAGDVLYPANLGGENVPLEPDERAIAVQVSDSGGLAGLLKPGDRVGITAVLFGSRGQGAFSKTITGGLRVLYVSPEFTASDPIEANPPPQAANSPVGGPGGIAPQSRTRRQDTGTVVLAVPTRATILAYDFAPFGVESETKVISIVDLLPALDHANNVELSLFLEPDTARSFITSGIYLPDLVITPGPSPTPTGTPLGLEEPAPEITPTP